MVRVAKLYYDLERTQNEIATDLGLTRWQVGRLLTEARELGIVRIEITPRAYRKTELEVRLQQEFGLKDAIVVPSGGTTDPALLTESVAQAAAKYLAGLNPKPELIGVSWGRTMSAVARFLPGNWNPGVHVILVNGSTNLRSTATAYKRSCRRICQVGNGSATLLPVPAIVGKKSTRDVLEEDPIIERVLTLAKQADVVCFGMGGITHESVLLSSGYLDEADIDRLKDAGAVGDILGRFVDRDGTIVDTAIDEPDRRPSARIPQDKTVVDWRRCRWREIADRPCAALKAGYVSVVVTDEATARYALGMEDGP